MNHQFNSRNNPLEILHVTSKKVSCQGASASSSHPLVYLNMGKNDFVVCPYCSKFFTIEKKDANNSVIIGIKNKPNLT
jgi:uncharacterized Zn-finger protein